MRAHLVGSIVLAVLPAVASAASCPDQTVECVPGGGRKTTACLSEWLVENPNAASFARRPSKTTETCLEGDPHCDFDGAGNGTCSFHVGLCLGGADSAFPSCAAAGVGSYEITKPYPDATKPADAALGQALVAGLLADFPGSTAGGAHGSKLTFTPPPAGTCTPPTLAVAVPLKNGKKTTRVVKGRSVSADTTRTDTDTLKLVCVPRPAPHQAGRLSSCRCDRAARIPPASRRASASAAPRTASTAPTTASVRAARASPERRAASTCRPCAASGTPSRFCRAGQPASCRWSPSRRSRPAVRRGRTAAAPSS